MSIDASRWDDWEGFLPAKLEPSSETIAEFLDAAPFALATTETGVKLRAKITSEKAWQRLAIAWRAAADLGASGELVWCTSAEGIAYRATVADYESRWEKLPSPPKPLELADLVRATR
ncbi:MAG: hypothetical protein HOV81_32265 [Kofleriaceae bacterium]|nr:hypothetical protein [Kofleriaceae bacterium]